MNKEFYSKWKQWQYYILIGVVSFVALFFLPMIGTEADLAWRIPTTTVGWIVYCTSKLLVAAVNILIFHCFVQQAKINVQDDPRYVEAITILDQVSPSNTERLRSPEEYFKEVYSKKGATVFITSILSAVGLTQAVLTFDWISMLTYFATILGGVVFGILQMNQVEIYWTTEFLSRARKKVKEEADEAKRLAEIEEHSKLVEAESLAVVEEEHIQSTDDSTGDIGGTDILESPDNSGCISDI